MVCISRAFSETRRSAPHRARTVIGASQVRSPRDLSAKCDRSILNYVEWITFPVFRRRRLLRIETVTFSDGTSLALLISVYYVRAA